MGSDWSLMDYYYFANSLWINANIVLIIPFLTSCYFRFFKQNTDSILWTDHFARYFLIFSWTFYIFDMLVKYQVDGANTICQKAFFIHHASSLFILPPLILNKHIPWWVCPIGFMHGFCIKFPELEFLNYIYAICLLTFHYGIYQHPYRNLKGYGFSRFFINFIWMFALMLLIGNCSNYLAIGPD